MIIKHSKQVNASNLEKFSVDVLICASGYEKRSTAFVKKYDINAKYKYVLSFSTFKDNPQRKKNDEFFKKNNFSIVEINDDFEVIDLLDRISIELKNNTATFLIDYSSMTSLWYAGMLQFFTHCDLFKSIRVLFNYSFASFIPAKDNSIRNKKVEPIQGYCRLALPDKPTALILGLGYEKDKAFGLSEYLDAETYVFYTEAEVDNSEYAAEVEKQNLDLMGIVKSENIIQYPLFDLDITQNILYQVCRDLRDRFRIVLAPCGPKPFTLISLILALKLGDLDVWRVSSPNSNSIYERTSNGRFSVIDCFFSSESTSN